LAFGSSSFPRGCDKEVEDELFVIGYDKLILIAFSASDPVKRKLGLLVKIREREAGARKARTDYEYFLVWLLQIFETCSESSL